MVLRIQGHHQVRSKDAEVLYAQTHHTLNHQALV